jgi:ABC-type bacteriocin/lantibiotic exporter with double-glycine peptidase domain
VTLAKLAGVELDEHQLARECFTSERGTENWYLARALQRHGMKTEFVELPADTSELPHPAIAGVVLSYGTGHFIPILGKEGNNYVIGDPLNGREVKSLAELRDEYHFTGFFMIVK